MEQPGHKLLNNEELLQAWPKKGCVSTFEWSTMILRYLQLFYGSFRQNLHHEHVYSGVPCVNRGQYK